MKKNLMKLVLVLVAVALVIPLTFYPQALSQNFKMLADGLDSFGGRASSANFSQRIGSGGQLAVGLSQDSSFYAWQGYVHAAAYEHGDANANGEVTIADVVYLINYIFRNGSEPVPMETGDVNGDNESNISDAVYLVNYLFKNGNPPINL
jgi:hypothetical protein